MCLKSVLVDVSLATVSNVRALQYATTAKSDSTVFHVKVIGCVLMTKFEQRVQFVEGLPHVCIKNSAVNARIAPRATSQANVLMDSRDQSVEIVVDPHIASIFGSDTSARTVTEQGSVNTIGKKANVLHAEISQFLNMEKQDKDYHGSALCHHEIQKNFCIPCKGSSTCDCGKFKFHCSIHGGSALCVNCKSTRKNSK